MTDQPLDLEAERRAQDPGGQGSTGGPGEPRARLDEEAQALAAQLDALDGLDHGTESGTFDDNFADSGQVAAEQGENRALAAQLREQLDDVERAIAKLDDGTYGACEVCGMAIGDSRLEAMPATRFCIEHAAG